MNSETAQILIEINNQFYRNHCDSFASTREHPWHGWKNLAVIKELYSRDDPKLLVFDLACGNLRFESFLASELRDAQISFFAVDNCNALIPQGSSVAFQSLDVLKTLQAGLSLSDRFAAPTCDLAVSFGFMHHVPLTTWQREILQSLLKQVRPGGYVVLSFWQFLNNAALAKKARTSHRRALELLDLPNLDDGDYLLGWKDIPGVYRYCHSFSTDEIDSLIASVANEASLVSRFVSDGRTDNLNTYLVLRVL